MNKEKIIQTLVYNGYSIHPLLGFYHKPKASFDNAFFVFDKEIIIIKIKSKNIDLSQPERKISISIFKPYEFTLRDPERDRLLSLKAKFEFNERQRVRRQKKLLS